MTIRVDASPYVRARLSDDELAAIASRRGRADATLRLTQRHPGNHPVSANLQFRDRSIPSRGAVAATPQEAVAAVLSLLSGGAA